MEKQMDDWIKTVDSIEGWLWNSEPAALIHLPVFVDHVQGEIVEIGSFKGKSTVAMGLGSKHLTKQKRPIHAIDPFASDFYLYKGNYFQEFWKNVTMAGLADAVSPIRKLSTQAYKDCPKKIALLFIDGNHDYEMVRHDIHHYARKVVRGGLIALHDYGKPDCPGVVKAVDEFMQHNPGYVHFCDYCTLRVIRRSD
ncbi:class I SAM-dependent methyltransferase [Paenibacillus mesophilus]|uniref:class I SAM-dependent methyltransferase n=1 Tax=Paenibacillus mesophilus TaxID=2582849 RepID=UPI00110EB02A|nr:class I SAM-dependent methyltransferase [Paenibacillus mesophilus]TMV50004.1 class I SAM-dependent methyltransferase [Paenibacillus mesophilus]